MVPPNLLRVFLLASCLLVASGCATIPVVSAESTAANDLTDDSLEILFATEFPVSSKDEALNKAAQAYRDGELDKAQFYFVRALKFDSGDVNLLARIGSLHVQQGNNLLAARAYMFAIQQEPLHAASLEGLGLLYFRAGNEAKAQETLEKALTAHASLWRAHNVLGVIADRHQRFDAADAHYEAALALEPSADAILINRGYSRYLRKNYREAALDFYEVAERRSGHPKGWLNLAMVYARQGWYDSALQCYLEILDPAQAHNELGLIAMSNGDFRDADRFLNEAIRLSPSFYAAAEKNLADLQRESRTMRNN